jgi:hypothetical protein
MPDPDEPFYIGYLPAAPPVTAAFIRKVVAAAGVAALTLAGGLAIGLRYAGTGEFEFGRSREMRGVVRCDFAPRLRSRDTDYLLVGLGKHRVAPEICGATGNEVVVQGTLIQREGKKLLEVSAPPSAGPPATAEAPAVPLGRFTLRGEIVDAKCYFGVMNPAEGRAHRACAGLCCA